MASTAGEENLWQSLLREVASSRGVETRNVVVLGDRGVGKSALLRSWAGHDVPGAATAGELALAYTHVNITEDGDDEVVGRVGFWVLEGVEEYSDLLRFALTRETWATSLVVVALDFSKPWTLEASARKWLQVLQRAWDALALSPGERDELQERVRRQWRTYREATAAAAAAAVAAAATGNDAAGDASAVGAAPKPAAEDDVVLPLAPGVLVANLGLPIVVLCLKSDAVDALRKKYDIGEPQLDFIQQTLRRVAMHYGAALACGSTLQNKVVDVVFRYITHRLFGGPDRSGGHSFARDAYFVPAGWDSPAKVALLTEGPVGADGRRLGGGGYPEGTAYEDVVPPPDTDKGARGAQLVAPLDEVAFLETLLDGGPVPPALEAASALDRTKSPRPRPTKPDTPSKPATPTGAAAAAAAAAAAGGLTGADGLKASDGQSTEQMQSFFQSLMLNKKPTGAAAAAAAGGPVTRSASGTAAVAPSKKP